MRRNIVRKRILVVEGDSLNRGILSNILSDSYDVVEASDGQEALDILKGGNERIDLIMLDVVMPVMDGYTLMEKLREDRMLSFIPVIVVTQSDTDESEIEALRRGAADFITKPYKARIIRHRIESILRLRDTAAIVNQLQYDILTGLYSRNYFFHRATEILDNNPETDYNIVCTNIVNFKVYNEVFGEKKGNEFLVNMARVLEKRLGNTGICGRFGGDRFVVLQERDCEELDRQRFDSEGAFALEGLSVKFGVYEITDRNVSVDSMCDRGFLAADSIKDKYNVGIAVYDDKLRTRLLREKAITESMETAVDNNEFEIYYQPKYGVDNIRLTGAEALIRWNHKELGYVSPGEFISIFEKNGFITKLDKYVFDNVCAQLGEWRQKGIEFPPVSVNLSRADVYCNDIVEHIMDCIRKNDLVPHDVHVEITESAYTEHPDQIIRMVDEMRECGLAIELDDFGSGYSSLNMLNEIKADYLKMDMRFIQSRTQKQTQQGILQLITNLARWMNMEVVAEGVETEEQLMRVRTVGCDYVQGFLFSKPVSAGEFEELLKKTDLQKPQYNVKDYEPAIIVATSDDEYAEAVREKFENEFVIYRASECEKVSDYLTEKVSAIILSTDISGDYNQLLRKLEDKRKHERFPVVSVFPPGIVTDEMLQTVPGDEFLCRCHPVSDLKNRVMNLIITD